MRHVPSSVDTIMLLLFFHDDEKSTVDFFLREALFTAYFVIDKS